MKGDASSYHAEIQVDKLKVALLHWNAKIAQAFINYGTYFVGYLYAKQMFLQLTNFSIVMTCICDNYFSTLSGASTSLLGKRKSMPMLPWCAITFYFNFMSRIFDVFILWCSHYFSANSIFFSLLYCPFLVVDGFREIFFHVWRGNWACTTKTIRSTRKTSKRSASRHRFLSRIIWWFTIIF